MRSVLFAVLLVACAACGRVGFDELGAGAGPGGGPGPGGGIDATGTGTGTDGGSGADGGLPVRTVLATGQGNPVSIAVDAQNVYWSTGAGTIGMVPIGGGAAVELATGETQPYRITATGGVVYWTSYAGKMIMRAAASGGDATIVTGVGGAGNPYGIAGDGASVFYAVVGAGTINRVAATGGTPSSIATGPIGMYAVAADATRVYFSNTSAPPTVSVVAKTGGAVTTLVTQAGIPAYDLAVDGTNVFWGTGNAIWRVPAAGGTPVEIVSGIGDSPRVATDGTFVYWTSGSEGTVSKLAIAGGTPIEIATGQANPDGIAVDATSVYWVNTGAGEIVRLSPK